MLDGDELPGLGWSCSSLDGYSLEGLTSAIVGSPWAYVDNVCVPVLSMPVA